MAQEEDLHALIKSLSPSEKRYINVMASKEAGTAKYAKLMNAIDSMEVYSDELLRVTFPNENFIAQLNTEKRNLMSAIFKAMRNFHADSSVDNQLRDLLQDEAFLRSKGLVNLRRKTLNKARDLATSYEKLGTLYQILEREFDFRLDNSKKDFLEECHSILDQKDQIFQQLNAHHRIKMSKEETYLAKRAGHDFSDPVHIDYLNEIFIRSGVSDPEKIGNALSRIEMHSLCAHRAISLNQNEEMLHHFKAVITIFSGPRSSSH